MTKHLCKKCITNLDSNNVSISQQYGGVLDVHFAIAPSFLPALLSSTRGASLHAGRHSTTQTHHRSIRHRLSTKIVSSERAPQTSLKTFSEFKNQTRAPNLDLCRHYLWLHSLRISLESAARLWRNAIKTFHHTVVCNDLYHAYTFAWDILCALFTPHWKML